MTEARRFKVAFSFPGEHRERVSAIADALLADFGREGVLYDEYHRPEFARLDLDVYLPALYRTEAELVVLVLCPEYADKRWCMLELRHIRQLFSTADSFRVMLLVVGDPGDLSPIGILRGDGHMDITDLPAEQVADHIRKRLDLNAQPSGVGRRALDAVLAKVDVSRLIQYAPEQLIGREADTQVLVDAWTQALAGVKPRPHVVSLVALGGEGKTALVAKWLARLMADEWAGADAVFAWSFYSQGTRDQSAASSDIFLAEALAFFGDAEMAGSAAHAVDKAKRLVQLLRERRILLVLDGLEPLQEAPTSPRRGWLKDGAVAALVKGLAAQSPGLCVVTTRYAVADLDGLNGGSLRRHPIERLSTAAGAALLRTLGVKGRAGELDATVDEVKGHALTLNLLGRYLCDAHGGDVRKRDVAKLAEADDEVQGGHAFRVMDTYVAWFEASGEAGQRAIALLRLMGLFDRPASAAVFEALLKAPVIVGLTEAVAGLSPIQRSLALKRLEAVKLLTVERADGQVLGYDAHPLIREYFAQRLQAAALDVWQAGHRRVFEYLCESTAHRPDTLEGLQPLYQAVAHGCLAGLHEVACIDVYRDRILRGTGFDGFYSWKMLGALGADLSAVACFFDPPWQTPARTLSQGAQSWLLSEAALRLRGLGRLREALEPMRAGLEMYVAQSDWRNAARGAGNLSELALTLGQVTDVLADAEHGVSYADRSGDGFLRMVNRTVLADAQHQAGRNADAAATFQAAEALQVERQPGYPLLYSVQGFQYCDRLLGGPERAAWRQGLGTRVSSEPAAARAACQPVAERAAKTLEWIQQAAVDLLSAALDHLTLGRAALYQAALGDTAALATTARPHLDAAVDGLRRAGRQDYLPRGLLARAHLRALAGYLTGPNSAQEDLDEAWDIAEPGPMRLFMADIHLHRARLFFRAPTYPWDSPAADLAAARALIEACGYGRRLEELADAEQVILA